MDDADIAQEYEAKERQHSLEKAKQAAQEPAQWIEAGQVRCLECGCQISQVRLKAKPDAAHCTDCKTYLEQSSARIYR